MCHQIVVYSHTRTTISDKSANNSSTTAISIDWLIIIANQSFG